MAITKATIIIKTTQSVALEIRHITQIDKVNAKNARVIVTKDLIIVQITAPAAKAIHNLKIVQNGIDLHCKIQIALNHNTVQIMEQARASEILNRVQVTRLQIPQMLQCTEEQICLVQADLSTERDHNMAKVHKIGLKGRKQVILTDNILYPALDPKIGDKELNSVQVLSTAQVNSMA